MGLDGGTIITRSDVLRGQSWELSQADDSRSTRGGSIGASHVHKRRKLDARAEKATKWSNCALSGEPLSAPVVADFLGTLYNKAAVLEFLLAKAGVFSEEAQVHKYINQLREAGGAFDHINSTKDVFEVRGLGSEGAGAAAPPTGAGAQGAAAAEEQRMYCCPITDLPCDRYPFCALAGCGHVFSERAQREMADGTCALCGAGFGPEDVVPINGTQEQVAALREALPQRRKAGKAARKKRQRQAAGAAEPGPQGAAATAAAEAGVAASREGEGGAGGSGAVAQ